MKNWLKLCLLILFLLCLPVVYVVSANFDTDAVVVAVLDTGVDPDHSLLKDRVIQGYDFASWDTDSSDPDGHGTHVAGIIAAEAPEALILSVRVIAKDDDVVNTPWAIVYAVLHGADIINMSFIEPESIFTKWAVAYGRSKGVIFVASSGNQGRNRVSYPSKYNGVYSIAGFDPRDQRVVGNIGEEVRYIAPGVNVRSAALNGGYVEKSGTSMSAGYISGAIAYIKTVKPDLKAGELDYYLELGSTEIVSQRVLETAEGKVFRVIELNHVKSGMSRLIDDDEIYLGVM
jgi:subtilisin family serine protease